MVKHILIALFLVPVLTLAHTDGQSLEAQIGNYFIDIGYEPNEFVEGVSSTFDFNLTDIELRRLAPYTHIWVRIENEEAVMFATSIDHADRGPTGLTYTFPKAGDYTFFVRFNDDDELVAEATFPLTVTGGETEHTMLLMLASFAAGFVLGGGLLAIHIKRKPRKRKEK